MIKYMIKMTVIRIYKKQFESLESGIIKILVIKNVEFYKIDLYFTRETKKV